jgi:hypothetical protein
LEGAGQTEKISSGKSMDLFLYIPKKNGAGDRLVQATAALSPDGAVSILRTFRQLTSRLRRPVDDRDVVVLLLPTRRHLDEIRTIAPLLERTRLIAILPDQAPETIAQGHRLRPRFLTTADHHFQDVAAVLEKMKGTAGPGPEARSELSG